MNDRANEHKLLGNKFYGQGFYEQAIEEYGIAIVKAPDVPTYYTNRARCFLTMSNHQRAALDAEKAIELDSRSVKGHLLLGEALAMNDNRIDGALHSLKKAYNLAIEQKVTYTEEIAQKILKAKKRRWELLDIKRRNEESDLHRYLHSLITRDRDRQLTQLDNAGVAQEDRDVVKASFDERLSQMADLLTRANDPGQRREVPDHFLGKISFEVMTDPVVSVSGISYDRTEILAHMRKIGYWDPLSRQPMRESDLRPNLALREIIEEFLKENGWAVDY
ncbi:uncharacterized protein EV422DRAFT_313575 [Fimicolochytrium jonesii]|uniref:uncharacterized protein n=1 Tax=Fimicolochytrium jonesii TaxID=1396493 RepID=UPI0022FE8F4F|nr:uncharacterized protein EV422DRAFT_313575 [Fimicolochytrium jonesii]KAI8824263.1 STIP1 homology and U box-containing protein 1-like protein [Fimicolochytrium jonesii]